MTEILNFLQSGNIGWAFIILIALWLTKLDILKLFEQQKTAKDKDIENLEKLISSEHIDDELKEVLKERLAQLSFHKYFGICVNKKAREALININKRYPEEANWIFLKRALPFFKFGEDDFSVEIKKRSIIGKYFVLILSSLVALYGIVVFVLGILVEFTEGRGLLQFGSLALAIFGFGVALSSFNWPLDSAKKIKELVEQNE